MKDLAQKDEFFLEETGFGEDPYVPRCNRFSFTRVTFSYVQIRHQNKKSLDFTFVPISTSHFYFLLFISYIHSIAFNYFEESNIFNM